MRTHAKAQSNVRKQSLSSRVGKISPNELKRQQKNQSNRADMMARYGAAYHVDPPKTGKAAERERRKAHAEAEAWSKKQRELRSQS